MTTTRDVMTEHPTTISAQAPIAEAAQVRWTLDLRHLPVVDDQGKLVGMLSDRDLRGLSPPYLVPEMDTGQEALEAQVGEVMSGDVLSIRPESDLADVVDLMLQNHIGAVPVVDEAGNVVGIVSYVDVLRALPKPGSARRDLPATPEPAGELLAEDIMTENPRTIGVNDPVGDAIDALQSMGVRHLPVVDDQGELVGMVSDRDLGSWARQFSEGELAGRSIVTLSAVPVGHIMSSDVASVDTDADVAEMVDTMLERNVGALPVVDGEGRPVGIVSYVDLLRALPFPRATRHEA
jgi:CBS domain-containing membrane protein